MQLLIHFLQINIDDKLNKAPDSNYQLGLIIGSFIPFIILVGVAYYFYYRAKKNTN